MHMALKWLMTFSITLYQTPTSNKTITFGITELQAQKQQSKFCTEFWFYLIHTLIVNTNFR
jgi:hypothetical protein